MGRAIIESVDERAGIQPRFEPLFYPLSFAQRRLWFLDKLEPGQSVYNVCEALRLKGRLDRDVLARSVNEIVRRHDTLRTTFREVNGNPVQVVAPGLTVDVALEDLSDLPAELRENEAVRRLSDQANQPYNLERGPLIAVVLIQLAADDHVLFIGMHHIVSEGGWSMSVFLRELNTLYRAFSADEPSPLPELAIQYGDYVLSEQDFMHGEVRDQFLDYWTKQLAGAPGVLNLPGDRPRPSEQSYAGSKEQYWLPASLQTALNNFSKSEGATLFMTLYAAFTVLLARYSGQEDFVVGVPVAGRGCPETHDLIGFFANTLAVRARLPGDPSFRELVERVREAWLNTYDYQDLPFELLVDALKPERSRAYSPVFQVMFAYQNAPHEQLSFPGIEVSPFEVEARTSMFDLTLFAWERPTGIQLSLEYSTDLFDRPTIQNLLRHLEVLLHGAMANPATRISQLPLLSGGERQRILGEWNSTGADYPSVPLQQLIEEQVRRAPDAPAVTCCGRTLSYRELNAQANRLAAHLRSMGVGPDTLVGVCLERSTDLVVALLAILKTGGAYLPLDPAYPEERIISIARDSGIGILIAPREIQQRLPDFRGRIVTLDFNILNRYAPVDCVVPVTGDHLAYVLYTSGSTGRPKGVAIPRKALTNLLWWVRKECSFTAADVLLGVTTISFDIAGVDIWLPLLSGARLVLADRDTAMDGRRLQAQMESEQVTFLQATPATWRLLLESGWKGQCGLKAVSTGEALPKDLARKLFPLVGTLWNLYGPTETTIWSAGCRISDPDFPILIGRPISNTQAYILDTNLAPVPAGVVGELYIGGEGVARGYLHQPDLTAERFISDPFRPGRRLYRTGDLARHMPDGGIECLGRNDHQIKLRGFRIEPEEIRAALTRHSAVSDAVAILDFSTGEGRIVAYVVAAGEGRPDVRQLRDIVRKSLPDYMLPSVFVFLEALPLNPNGKVDRNALPAPEGSAAKAGFAGPRNEIETRLQRIWEDVLGVQPIGIRDDYFELGGYSLLAVRLFFEITKEFEIKLPLATLYQAPTIESLAAVLSEGGRLDLWDALVPINRSGHRPPFYCVSGVGGGVLVFRDLAEQLGADQPFYGLQPSDKTGQALTLTTIEEIAQHYIATIRKIQPEGPYFLSGYSFGGLVAFEMAHQLTDAGSQVALLGFFDTTAPLRAKPSGNGLFARRTYGTTWQRVRAILSSDDIGGAVRDIFRRRQLRLQERVARALNLPLPSELETLKGSQGFAALNYVGRPYAGPVTLFRSQIRPSNELWSRTLGWEQFVSNIEVRDVPGDHLSIYAGPNVGALAAEVRSCLVRLQSKAAPMAATQAVG